MAQSILNNVRIAGIATCVPKTVISNLDCPPEQRSMRERLVRNIGIASRRQSPPDVCLSDLTQHAAEKLIKDLGWRKDEIDALIVVTQSADHAYPGNAVILQDRLQLPTSCLAFDINLGCSGYPYGLYVAGSMISAGRLKKVLLLVGDKSTNPNSQDQGFAVLFSDAGTATALVYDENASPAYFDMYSDGSGYKAIYAPAGGNRLPLKPEHLEPQMCEDGVVRRMIDIVLDGPAILNFSTNLIPPAVEKLLEQAGMSKDDIDWYLFHQANKMINETIRKKLGLPPEKVPSTLYDFGNTSSASIPLTLCVHAREAALVKPQRMLMSGFGVGLSWASCIMDVGPIVIPELIEI